MLDRSEWDPQSWSLKLRTGKAQPLAIVLLATVCFGWTERVDGKTGIPLDGFVLRLGMEIQQVKRALSGRFDLREAPPGTFGIWDRSGGVEQDVGSFSVRDGKIVYLQVVVGRFDPADLPGFFESLVSIFSRWAEDLQGDSPVPRLDAPPLSLRLRFAETDEIRGSQGAYTLRLASFRSGNRRLTVIEERQTDRIFYTLRESLSRAVANRAPKE